MFLVKKVQPYIVAVQMTHISEMFILLIQLLQEMRMVRKWK